MLLGRVSGQFERLIGDPAATTSEHICRSKDESHPSRAIIRAYGRMASRTGAAGYELTRSLHVHGK